MSQELGRQRPARQVVTRAMVSPRKGAGFGDVKQGGLRKAGRMEEKTERT